jgi:L,D-transpeptidase ErfK/SrfK
VGTTVEFIYEPVKFGYLKGHIFVEVHEDIYSRIQEGMLSYAMKRLQERNLAGRIDWRKFLQAVAEQSGAPVDITLGIAPLAQSLPPAP